jgi:hypothetical protein
VVGVVLQQQFEVAQKQEEWGFGGGEKSGCDIANDVK